MVSVAYDSGVASIQLNRPERLNALCKQMLIELNEALDWAEAEDDVRALVLSGSGRGFSSGFDLKEQSSRDLSDLRGLRDALDLDFTTTMRFWHSRKPTIAAVHGPCVAGAFEMALACDITIADGDAVFGEPELRFGAGIVTMLLPWITSPKHAKRIIFSGQDSITAKTALEMGFISEIAEPGRYLDKALAIARNIAKMDPSLVHLTKRAIQQTYDARGLGPSLSGALDIDYVIEAQVSPDKVEFLRIAREQGLQAALRWRANRFEAE